VVDILVLELLPALPLPKTNLPHPQMELGSVPDRPTPCTVRPSRDLGLVMRPQLVEIAIMVGDGPSYVHGERVAFR
jgi:hypothetical protein